MSESSVCLKLSPFDVQCKMKQSSYMWLKAVKYGFELRKSPRILPCSIHVKFGGGVTPCLKLVLCRSCFRVYRINFYVEYFVNITLIETDCFRCSFSKSYIFNIYISHIFICTVYILVYSYGVHFYFKWKNTSDLLDHYLNFVDLRALSFKPSFNSAQFLCFGKSCFLHICSPINGSCSWSLASICPLAYEVFETVDRRRRRQSTQACYMGQSMRLWYVSSSVNSFFKRACAAIQ